MIGAVRLTLAAVCLWLPPVGGTAAAQEFQPPASGGVSSGGLRLDLLSFSTRAGADVTSDLQAVLGTTVDVAQLWSPAVHLRPSFEVGFGRSGHSFHVASEVLYRFQPDGAPAIPYLGIGVGYYQEGARERVWPTIVMGFELSFRPSFNWLLEYHALDRLGRHRFLLGLSARGAAGGS